MNHISNGSGYQVIGARTFEEAQSALRAFRPVAVVMDILDDTESGWALLAELKSAETTRDIPVFVLTTIDDRTKALRLGARRFLPKACAPTVAASDCCSRGD